MATILASRFFLIQFYYFQRSFTFFFNESNGLFDLSSRTGAFSAANIYLIILRYLPIQQSRLSFNQINASNPQMKLME